MRRTGPRRALSERLYGSTWGLSILFAATVTRRDRRPRCLDGVGMKVEWIPTVLRRRRAFAILSRLREGVARPELRQIRRRSCAPPSAARRNKPRWTRSRQGWNAAPRLVEGR